MVDDGFDPGLLSAPTTSPDSTDGSPPPGGGTTGVEGSLQVLEPPTTSGLLDTIVGDVVASFLGK
jgi:hypothetical protein